MENLSFIMMFAVIIVGVLQICLFFKVWGMCNNVIKIRKQIVVSDDSYYWTIRRLLTKGEIDKAEDVILSQFFNCIQESASDLDDVQYQQMKGWLRVKYQAIGREVPEAIAQAHTLHDLKRIFEPTYKV